MRKLVVLMFTAFVDMVGLVMVLPLLPFYASELGADALMVGLLVSAFSIAQLLSAPFWGRLSDIRGRRPAILTGLLVSAVAYVIFAYAGSLLLLLLSRLVQGFGGGTIGVVQAYVADASEPHERAKGLGWLSAATSLGAVVGPALGSLLVRFYGRSAPGLAAAGLCVAVAIFAWKYLGEARESLTDSDTHTATHPATSGSAIMRVLRSPLEPASRLIWIYAIAIGAFYGTVPVLPLLLADRLAVTETTIGYFIMYLGAMGLVIRSTILGPMVDRLGEIRLCRLGLALLATGLALLWVTFTYPVLFVSLTLMPLGTAFTFPCVTSLLTRAIRKRERGLYLGVQASFGGVSRVAFPIAVGLAMDRLGAGVAYLMAGLLVGASVWLTTALDLPSEG
ncbi:MAG: MFS transporter [Gemmatimonadaceae bacterium]|nr:MFS transporter [Gemmatimonadaceae bacterium]